MNLFDIVDLRRTGHFVYESGHHGDTWLALDRLFVDQRRLARVAGALADRLGPHRPEVICGALVGGALLGQWVAAHLDLPFVYAERTPPTGARYGLPPDLAGLVDGRRVAMVDDAVNAGAATLATVAEVARLGGKVPVMAAIFVRAPGGLELLSSSGLVVEHLIGVPFTIWDPTDCPLCAEGDPLGTPGGDERRAEHRPAHPGIQQVRRPR